MGKFDDMFHVEFDETEVDPFGLTVDIWDTDVYDAYDDRLSIENTYDEFMLHAPHTGAEYLAAWWAYNDEEDM